MQYTKLNIGDAVELPPQRGIIGQAITPVWHVLEVAPQKERAARERLKAVDQFAFFPSEEKVWFVRGKRFEREQPMITRMVYARFTCAPQWDILKERRIITGVFSINGIPIVIPPDIIRRVQGLPTDAERLAAAKAELLRIREGDRAELTDGPFAGHVVDVFSVAHGRVWWETITGVKGSSDQAKMKRLDV